MGLLDKIKKLKPSSSKNSGSTDTEGGVQKFVAGIVSTKDIIAPGALEVDFDYIRIDNRYYRTVFVASYPRFVDIGWLSTLINFDSALNVSMYIFPSDGKEVLDDLRRKITEMEAELNSDVQKGKIANPSTQAKLEDALNLQADLVRGQERFFQFGLYVTIGASSLEELNRINRNLESNLGSLMLITKKATLQMEDGFKTTLPTCNDKLKILRNMDTTSLATTFPFVSSDLSDDKGIMYGINEHNGSLVIFDRFSMPNYNSVVFATAGAGKSYLVKLEALRSVMMGADIIIIDPENEYRDLAESVGGQYIAFGYSEESKINPFDLSLVNEEGENALNAKALSLHKLFKVMLGEMDPMDEAILDKAIMGAYKMKGITEEIETQKKEAPLIEDVYKILLGNEDEKSKMLAVRLEKFIKGSFAGIFNQKTTVNLKNNFVVFGIKNLEDSLRPVAMQIILDYIWTIVRKDLRKRILVVDEAWYLMKYPDSSEFLRGIVKRGRKYFLGVTTITQDVDDFLRTEHGKEIVTNSSIQILLKQHSAAIDQIGEVFYLSSGEKQLLLTADKGEGIFFAGQNHVAIRVIASDEENRLITSNPEELLKMKKAREKIEIKTPAPIASMPKTEQKMEMEPSASTDIINEVKTTPQQGASESVLPKVPVSPIETVLPKQPVAATLPKVELISPKQNEELIQPITKPKVFSPSPSELSPQGNKKPIEEPESENEVIIPIRQKIQELELVENKKLEEFKQIQEVKKQEEKESNDKLNELKRIIEQVNKNSGNNPLFINKNEEVKVPQPPQLQKKQQAVFETPNSVPLAKIELVKKPVDLNTGKVVEDLKPATPTGVTASPSNTGEAHKPEEKKPSTDYDKLFGNGIV